jgi:hypothetical protein
VTPLARVTRPASGSMRPLSKAQEKADLPPQALDDADAPAPQRVGNLTFTDLASGDVPLRTTLPVRVYSACRCFAAGAPGSCGSGLPV